MRPHTHTKLLCLNFSEEKTFGIKNMKLFKKDQEIGQERLSSNGEANIHITYLSMVIKQWMQRDKDLTLESLQ